VSGVLFAAALAVEAAALVAGVGLLARATRYFGRPLDAAAWAVVLALHGGLRVAGTAALALVGALAWALGWVRMDDGGAALVAWSALVSALLTLAGAVRNRRMFRGRAPAVDSRLTFGGD
jgi:hypothetical protein